MPHLRGSGAGDGLVHASGVGSVNTFVHDAGAVSATISAPCLSAHVKITWVT